MKDFIITKLFMGVLSMSLTVSVIGLFLTAIHPLTEKFFSKKWNYYIWLLVVVRMAVPFHLETDFMHILNFCADIRQTHPAATYSETITGSLGDAAPVYSGTITDISKEPDATVPIPDVATQAVSKNSNNINTHISSNANPDTPIFSATSFLTAAAYLWFFGVFATLFIKLWAYYRFQSAIKKERVRITDYNILSMENAFCANLGIRELPVIYGSSGVSGPLTVGLWNPVIVFPSNIVCKHLGNAENNGQNPAKFQLMLHHELIHVARKDLLYKWIYQLLCCIHWFNPLLGWFCIQINRACELSCDEAILVHLTNAGRQMYGNILLDTAAYNIGSKNSAFSTTLLKNKKDLKKRLDNILNHGQKTRFQLILSVCTLVIVLSLSACSSIWITMSNISEQKEQQNNDASNEKDSNAFLSNFSEPSKNSDAWNVYDADTLIAGNDVCDNWYAYNYFGGQNLTASRMALYGSNTIVIAYADKNVEVDITSSFDIIEGKFKIVSIAPDGTVTTINDTGTEFKQTITMKEGRNVIKLVGQGAKLKKLALNYSDLNISDFKKVYFSESEEYIAQLKDKLKAGETIEKNKVMDSLYLIQNEKEVSETFHTMLISRVSFTSEELCDFFIYSDLELSSKYLIDAIEDGYQNPLDAESVSAVMPYIDENYKVKLLMQLPKESFYDTLKDNIFYLDSEQIEECLTDYIQNGGTLTYADFYKVSFYLNESAINKISSMLSESSK